MKRFILCGLFCLLVVPVGAEPAKRDEFKGRDIAVLADATKLLALERAERAASLGWSLDDEIDVWRNVQELAERRLLNGRPPTGRFKHDGMQYKGKVYDDVGMKLTPVSAKVVEIVTGKVIRTSFNLPASGGLTVTLHPGAVTDTYSIIGNDSNTSLKFDGETVTSVELIQRLSTAKGEVAAKLWPRLDRYGAVTTAEFTSKPKAAKGTNLYRPGTPYSWCPICLGLGYIPCDGGLCEGQHEDCPKCHAWGKAVGLWPQQDKVK